MSSNYNGSYYEVYGYWYCYFTCYVYRDWYVSNPYAYSSSPIGWYFPTGTKITFHPDPER